MNRIVADSSVIVKFFVNEVYSDKALNIRDSFIEGKLDLLEPSLLKYEVTNAVKYSKNKFSLQEVKNIAKALENYDFKFFDLNESLSDKAIELSFKHHLTFYDAIYVALAETKNSSLYTADEKLINSANLKFVKHVNDFTLL